MTCPSRAGRFGACFPPSKRKGQPQTKGCPMSRPVYQPTSHQCLGKCNPAIHECGRSPSLWCPGNEENIFAQCRVEGGGGSEHLPL